MVDDVDLFGETSNSSIDGACSILSTSADMGEQDVVMAFILEFGGQEKKDLLKCKLNDLGVENLSHLEVLNLQESLKDILKPVQIGLLERRYKEIHLTPTDNKESREVVDFNKIFNANQLKLLNCGNKLSKIEVADVVRSVGDHLYLNLNKVPRKFCGRVAHAMLSSFGSAFHSTKKKSLKAKSFGLQIQIHNRVRYRSKLQRKRKARASNACRQSNALLPLANFSNRQNHGLIPERDLPLQFPPNESSETQESKRLEMAEMSSSGEVNWKKVKKNMADTFVAQRLAVNCLQRMDKVLKEWPFFGKFSIMRSHYFELIGMNRDQVEQEMTSFCGKFIKYLEAEGNEKKLKGRAGETAKLLRGIIKERNKNENSSVHEFLAVILGAAAKMRVDLSKMFIYFDADTSRDEVAASNKLPKDGKPIVAVLGDDIMKCTECYVLIDNCTTYTQPTCPMKAVCLLFMSYFVMKITYPIELYPLLYFMEREIFCIEVDENSNSSRAERLRKANGVLSENPLPVPQKYTSLMRRFEEFQDLWS